MADEAGGGGAVSLTIPQPLKILNTTGQYPNETAYIVDLAAKIYCNMNFGEDSNHDRDATIAFNRAMTFWNKVGKPNRGDLFP